MNLLTKKTYPLCQIGAFNEPRRFLDVLRRADMRFARLEKCLPVALVFRLNVVFRQLKISNCKVFAVKSFITLPAHTSGQSGGGYAMPDIKVEGK